MFASPRPWKCKITFEYHACHRAQANLLANGRCSIGALPWRKVQLSLLWKKNMSWWYWCANRIIYVWRHRNDEKRLQSTNNWKLLPSVELALAGEEQACIFDSTPAMTSPESASNEPSDSEKTVRKPCTLQTITLAPSWSLHVLDGHMATRQPWGKNQPSDSPMQIHSCVDPLQIGCKKQWTVLHSSPYRATRLSKSILHILAIMRLFNKYNDTTQYRTIYNTRFLHVHLPFMASMARINCCDQSITSS